MSDEQQEWTPDELTGLGAGTELTPDSAPAHDRKIKLRGAETGEAWESVVASPVKADEKLVLSAYPYTVPDFDEWLEQSDIDEITLRKVFEAGERYGADCERGGIFNAMPDMLDNWTPEELEAIRLIRGVLLAYQKADQENAEEEKKLAR